MINLYIENTNTLFQYQYIESIASISFS